MLLVATLAGCATTPTPLRGTPDLLNFLAEGSTTKEQALTTLGQPSGCFESEKILTYRLGYEPGNRGYYVLERAGRSSGWPVWSNAAFSLVLVFDQTGVLQKHSLVRVNYDHETESH